MKILDVYCGSKMFWYDKQESHTTYMDILKAVYTSMDRGKERKIEIAPDVQADWKHILFDDSPLLSLCGHISRYSGDNCRKENKYSEISFRH